MSNANPTCNDERRRRKVRQEEAYGLDYLEVCDDRRTLCVYFLGKAPAWLKGEDEKPEDAKLEIREIDLPIEYVRIEGGRRITDLKIIQVILLRVKDPAADDFLKVKLECPGDFSTYTLSLVRVEDGRPVIPPDIDPRYAQVTFNFNIEDHPSDLDCRPALICPPEQVPPPEIDYLAKDYASFRRLILDRLALIMPDWQERHVPDMGIALVEILAYAGDQLSYYQDAVATEAYLDTARQRISVRRHARLVDYFMHEGCNARAWVFVKITGAAKWSLPANQLSFITGHNERLSVPGRVLTWHDLRDIPSSRYEVFEPLVENPNKEINLYEAHNQIKIYTWGDKECCLPAGATTIILVDGPPGKLPGDTAGPEQSSVKQTAPQKEEPRPEYDRQLHLEVGDVLIFEEVKGPKTGNEHDADPLHRHAVRLTGVTQIVDRLYDQPLLEVTWAEEDSLPFPLCLSAVGPAPKCELIEDISIARGNLILVDHGRRTEDEAETDAEKRRWCVPTDTTLFDCRAVEQPGDIVKASGRFQPYLKKAPLTFYQSPVYYLPASAMLSQDPRLAKPWIQLTSVPDPTCQPVTPPKETPSVSPGKADTEPDQKTEAAQLEPLAPTQQENAGANNGNHNGEAKILGTLSWEAQRDLLSSTAYDPHFVVEIDNYGRVYLRFGDGELGYRPEAETRFRAVYRIGNGLAGNVGAEAISHLVLDNLQSGVTLEPCNPLPAWGGIDPEPLDDVKLFAPHAFRRRLERAITAADYAEIVMRDFAGKVQRAAAVLRWTGSWYEVLVVVDQRGREEAEQSLLDEISRHLEGYRRIGHDLVVKSARLVPLDIELEICVRPGYLSGHVKAALLAAFSNLAWPDGRRGFFHPDNLTFGEGVYLSKLVAAAQAVPGVESTIVKKLERLYEGPRDELQEGLLPLGPLEVAQLDNDPNYPENGQFKLVMRGGR